MSKILIKPGPSRIAIAILMGLLINFTFVYSCSFDSYADEGSSGASGQTPPASSGSNTSYSIITHSHRGDSVSGGGCYSVPVYHTHEGNETDGGACYATPVYHTHSDACHERCDVLIKSITPLEPTTVFCYDPNHYGYADRSSISVTLYHTKCGHADEYRVLRDVCYGCHPDLLAYAKEQLETYHDDSITCGKTEADIDGYALSCTKGADHIEHYDLGCGLSEKEYGSIAFTSSNTSWTNEDVFLTGTLSDPEGVIGAGGYGAVSFSTDDGVIAGQTPAGIKVSSNGTYKMSVSVDTSKFDTASSELMITVNNIDKTPPVIGGTGFNDTSGWVRENVITVDASDAASELADEPYSFDGGNTWQASNSYTASESGEYTVCVRDKCGNISVSTVVIDNIDSVGPAIDYTPSAEEWHEGDGPRTFVFAASDEDSGMSEVAYSYDGGQTWTDSNSVTRDEPGTFTVMVRDGAGNITVIEVENEYAPAPDPGPSQGGGQPSQGETGGSGSSSSSSGSGTSGSGAGTGGSGTPTPGTGGESGTGGTSGETGKPAGEDTKEEDKDPDNKDKDEKDKETDEPGTSSDGDNGNADKDKDKKKNTGTAGNGTDEGNGQSGSSNNGSGAADQPNSQNNAVSTESSWHGSANEGIRETTAVISNAAADKKEDKKDEAKIKETEVTQEAEDTVKINTLSNTIKKKNSRTKGLGVESYSSADYYENRSLYGADTGSGWVEFGSDSGSYYYPIWDPDNGTLESRAYVTEGAEISEAKADIAGHVEKEESGRVDMDIAYSGNPGTQEEQTAETGEDTPFYKTRAFKVTASVGGGTVGAAIPLAVLLFMYSGVIVCNYDSKKYRFMGIKMVHRSERGRYVKFGRDFTDRSYSGKYKLFMGAIFTRMHRDELLNINADGDWISVPVQKKSIITIKNS